MKYILFGTFCCYVYLIFSKRMKTSYNNKECNNFLFRALCAGLISLSIFVVIGLPLYFVLHLFGVW